MNMIIIVKALTAASANPSLIRNFSLPNVNFPTMGGEVFWDDVANVKGWRLQRNKLTRHARILDPDNFRRAWGGIDAMEELLQRLADASDGYLSDDYFERV